MLDTLERVSDWNRAKRRAPLCCRRKTGAEELTRSIGTSSVVHDDQLALGAHKPQARLDRILPPLASRNDLDRQINFHPGQQFFSSSFQACRNRQDSFKDFRDCLDHTKRVVKKRPPTKLDKRLGDT